MTTYVGVIASVAKQSRCRPAVRWAMDVERGNAVLLHGFLKKSQKISQRELQTTKTRLADLRERT
jgi:phage-related protein